MLRFIFLYKKYLFKAGLLLLIFIPVLLHYLLWVKTVVPLPEGDGLFQYYYPLLNYLRAAHEIGNDPFFLAGWSFNGEYSYGAVLLGALAAGLGLAELILAEPYLLNIFCIIPFVFCAFFFSGGMKKRLIIGFLFCFFPVSQICFKQFSLLGLTVSWALLGLLFFRSWVLYKNWGFLAGFIFCFWFAAILKHLGLLLLINFIAVYLLWAVINHRLQWRVVFLCLFILAAALLFYSPDGLKGYVISSLTHNSFIAAHPYAGFLFFFVVSLILLSVPTIFAFYLRSIAPRQRYLPKFFRDGMAFFLICPLFLLSVVLDPFSPVWLAFSSCGVLFFLLYRYRFHGLRGFVYLYGSVTSITLLTLYSSGIGRVSHSIFLPMLLILVQTVSETAGHRFRFLLLGLFFVLSNFFPDFMVLEHYWSRFGREVYLTLFNNPFHNPLGWNNYGFGAFKKAISAELSQYSFTKPPLFVVENFGPFSAHLVFYQNVIYSFPPMQPLEWTVDPELYKKLYYRYMEKGERLFDELWNAGDIPVLVYGDSLPFNERGYVPLGLHRLLNKVGFSIDDCSNDLFAFAFSHDLLKYFQQNGQLMGDYNCMHLPVENPIASLCVDKRLKKVNTPEKIDYGFLRISDMKQIKNGD